LFVFCLLAVYGCSGNKIDEKFNLDPSSRDLALAKNFFKKGLDAHRRGDFLDAEINFLKAEVLIGDNPSIKEARSLNKKVAEGSENFRNSDWRENPTFTVLVNCLENDTCHQVVLQLNQLYCENFDLNEPQAIIYFALGGKVLDTPFCKNERLKQEILKALRDSKYFRFKRNLYKRTFSNLEFRLLALASSASPANIQDIYNLIPDDVLELLLKERKLLSKQDD